MRRALITGITGQDGSYLAEFLLAKGYEVHGIIRRASTFNTERLDVIYADPHDRGAALRLHYGDLSDGTGLRRVLESVQPDEIYNLAAQSHVRVSFEQSEYTGDVVATGTLRLLEAVRDHIRANGREVRIYQAGSSEMFGAGQTSAIGVDAVLSAQSLRRCQSGRALVCRELPRSVGHAHLQRHSVQPRIAPARRNVRDAQDHPRAHAHQSGTAEETIPGKPGRAPRLGLRRRLRGRHVADAAAAGARRLRRGYGRIAFGARISGSDGVAFSGWTGPQCVETDPRYFRPTEVDFLEGTPRKRARSWVEATVSFRELAAMMVEHDLELARQERTLTEAGHRNTARGMSIG